MCFPGELSSPVLNSLGPIPGPSMERTSLSLHRKLNAAQVNFFLEKNFISE